MVNQVIMDDVQDATLPFEAFYSQFWSDVYRAVAVAVGEADVAREAVDEAMTRAYERWGAVSGMKNPKGWVYRVAVNWSRSFLRRRVIALRKRPKVDWVIEDAEVADPAVMDAVGRLPAHQRDVIIARFLLDMSEQDTAESFGIPAGTVKSRVSRALVTLREELS